MFRLQDMKRCNDDDETMMMMDLPMSYPNKRPPSAGKMKMRNVATRR